VSVAAAAPRPAAPSAAEATWAGAAYAQALLAVDPHGLGGVHLRAGAGPVRERWLADLRALMPATEPMRRMPGHIADERLLGGLDLGATLSRGKPVAQRGLLAEADGGLVIAPMAERLSAGTAARLAGVLDRGEVGFERDGLSAIWPARVGLVACDEGGDDDDPLPRPLVDRLAFSIDLRLLSLRDCADAASDAVHVLAARQRLPRVTLDERVLTALCGTALQLGVDSARATLLALRAARAAAALAGRTTVEDEDAQLAARLVLAPRATRLPPPPPPPPPDEDAAPPEPPPPEPPEAQDDTRPGDPPESEPAEQPEQQAQPDALEDRLIEAAIASLPAGLLAALQSGAAQAGQAGRVGALSATPRGGRPVGTRRGTPRGGARLALVDTLRAAAPWQPLRRAAAPQHPGRIHIQADDLRVARLQQRAATATLFVIDASGSSALHRLAEAKGAVNLLLADCYVRRDQVGVVAFRGRGAELLLPPTRSLVRARRSLAALPGGGGTPLAAGLEVVLRVALQVRRSGATPVVVLLTDGRANIARDGSSGRVKAEADALAMARQLRAARVTALVVDTSPQPAAAAQRLAATMAASYRALPYAGAKALSAAVQALPRQVG
jgi:magnesium chelatase subunit D